MEDHSTYGEQEPANDKGDDATVVHSDEIQSTENADGPRSDDGRSVHSEESTNDVIIYGQHRSGTFTEDQFNTLCRQVGLHHWAEYYRIQHKDVFKVRKDDLTNSKTINEENVISLFFRRLLSNDHRAITLFRSIYDHVNEEELESEDESSDESESIASRSSRDAIFAIFHCCDDFLRQELLSKMVSCQLAVPLILPKRIPNEGLVLLLWEMLPVCKILGEEGVVREECIAKFPFATVSFVKYGNLKMSKSDIANKMLGIARGNIKHPFFITSSEDDGNISTWSNGTVEAVWSTHMNNNVTLPATCFLNLRGSLDIESSSIQECFLQKYSTCMIIFCAHNHVERLENNLSGNIAAKNIIIVSILNVLEGAKKKNISIKKHKQIIKVCIREFNLQTVANELLKIVSSVLKNGQHKRSLFKDAAKLCNECGIENTALNTVSKQAETAGMAICKQTSGDKGSEYYKNKVFKLQESWNEWSREFKDTTWKTSDRMKDIDKKEQNKLEIRRVQVQMPLSQEMKTMLETLDKWGTYELKHLFYWVNVFYSSRVRDTRIQLLGSMKTVGDNLTELDDKLKRLSLSNTSKLYTERTEVAENQKSLEERSADNSLSISHIVRELGQIYESHSIINRRKLNKDGNTVKYQDLPKKVADMILTGHSFEIFDGDACNVPISWVKAVFRNLSDLTNNARIFTISVLGMQSSGKSTLLNSMFGVDCPVSSGRCTRGISLQLLEVDDSLQEELGCEYIALIDTEGLGAPEKFSKGGSLLDNELATFAICLSDLTLINVRGEYVGKDLSNILQIAAHAFMRMTKVKLRSYCRIIQHSVNDIAARQNNMSIQQIILRELDNAVASAAKQEGRSNEFSKFTDIFNLSCGSKEGNYIHYIPGFTEHDKGNYSESVLNLKQELLAWLTTSTVTSLSMLDFSMRLRDIWMAIVQEDFIFSFKNTVEIREYNELKLCYRKEILYCDKKLLACELQYENMLTSMSPTDVKQELDKIHVELKNKLGKLTSRVNSTLTEYIQKNGPESLKKYEIGILEDFTKYIEANEVRLRENFENITENVLEGNKKENEIILEVKSEIILKLRESASKFIGNILTSKGTGIQKEDIDEIFENTWKEQINYLRQRFLTPDKTKFVHEVKFSILETIKKCCTSAENLSKFVKQKLETKDLSQYWMPMDGKNDQDIDNVLCQLLPKQHEWNHLLNQISETCQSEELLIHRKINEALFNKMYVRDETAVNKPPRVEGTTLSPLSEFTTGIVSIDLPGDVSGDVVLNIRHIAKYETIKGNMPAGKTKTRFLDVHLNPYRFETSFQKVVSLLGSLVKKSQEDITFNYYPTLVCLICWLCFEIKRNCQLTYLLQIIYNPDCYSAVFGEPLVNIDMVKDYISSIKGDCTLTTTGESQSFSNEKELKTVETVISELDFPSTNLFETYKKIAKDLFHKYMQANNSTTLHGVEYEKAWADMTKLFIDRLCDCQEQNVKKRWIDMVDENCHGRLWDIRHIRDNLQLHLRNKVRFVYEMHPDPFSDVFACDKRASTMPWQIPEIQFLDISLLENLKDSTNISIRRILVVLATYKHKLIQHLKNKQKFEKVFFEMVVKEITHELMKEADISTEDIATSLVNFGAWALPLCVDAQIVYNKDQNIANRIIDDKSNIYEDFKSYAYKKHGDERQANRVYSLLEDSFNKALKNKILTLFYNTLVDLQEFSSRENFLYTVLLDICENENFIGYVDFIHNNKIFLETQVMRIIVDKCSNKEIACIDPSVFLFVDSLREDVKDSLRIAKDQFPHVDEDTSKQLFQTFIDMLHKQLPCNKDKINEVKQFIDIRNFYDFEKTLFNDIDKLCDSVNNMYRAVNEYGKFGVLLWISGLGRPLPQNIVSRLIGCENHCPYCKAMCDITVEHTQHSAALHYPVGIGGIRDQTRSLITRICTTFVMLYQVKFSQEDEYLPASMYKRDHPGWFIKPELVEDANNYWKWVLKTFNIHFAYLYGAKEADLPSGWLKITKDDAKECIRCIYKTPEDIY